MSRFDVAAFAAILRRSGNRTVAASMSKYMKNQFPFAGVQTPQRRKLLRDYCARVGWPLQDELPDIVDQCWQAPEREMQYVACDLLDRSLKRKPPVDWIVRIEGWIKEKSWWDSVDDLSGQIAGGYFRHYRTRLRPIAGRWSRSKNLWSRRASLLLQLRYRQDTDAELLFELCSRMANEDEFFIQKGIGWALRQYSRYNPKLVRAFVRQTTLSALSRREALKLIERARK